jgi:diguanylate cyclase (GGDEF)-like protein/PAS domain S-box-containing protein
LRFVSGYALNRTTEIQSAQLRQLLSISKVSLLTSVSLALILAYMQHAVVAAAALVAWCVFMVLASILRAATILAYRNFAADDASTVRTALLRFRLGVLVAGAVWGAAGFLLFPAAHPQHQIFLILVLMGMSTGGVISFSADLFSAIVFSVALAVPLMLRLFIAGDAVSVAMGVAALTYLGFLILTLRRINQHIIDNILLRLEAAEREAQVRASEERYRLLLAHAPVGIFHYDTNLMLTYCNEFLARLMDNSVERLIGLDMKNIKDKSIQPALRKALAGELGDYEGHYQATLSDASKWVHMICAPLRNDAGQILGGIAIVQDISERKAAEETIRALAYYDHLTDLPNRRLLLDRLRRALAASVRSGRSGALLFIDLDNFKVLNDTLGHDMGDLLLQQVAHRLSGSVRDSDFVARLGGDEFVVMLEELNEEQIEAAAQAEMIGEKILVVLGRPYQLAMHEYRSTPSIGITLFSGEQQVTTEELLKQADIAMYQAKKAGNTLCFFDQQMQLAVTARAALESELRKALARQQFRLYYQLQVDSERRLLGAEALLRWEHPERGLLSPDQFIRVVEETDLILPVGDWVLETACAQLRAWQQDAWTRGLTLAVNVSANQFRQPDFVQQVRAVLRRHGINPQLLKLELLESTLLENVEETIVTMQALRESGVLFSLDDFGTGFSSLQYLKRLPIDQLKIDRSFVRDIASDDSDKAIVRTIIAMAGSLNMGVIAEGVETEEQRQFLLDNGCRDYQGYLFSKPLPLEQFEQLLKQFTVS